MLFFTIFRKRQWKLLYSVHAGSNHLDAQLNEDIPELTLTQFITLVATGSSDKYSDSFIVNSNSAYRYAELFSFYVSERVSEGDYGQLESGLVTAWNSFLNGKQAQSIAVLRQEEVVTAEG